MNKIKADTIIISNYDHAYYWSIYLDGKIYTREDIKGIKEDNPIRHLFNAYSNWNFSNIDNILSKYFEYKILIECDDGFIEIKEK